MPIARTLFTEDKKLRIFDFDDTLVKTNSFILVNMLFTKKGRAMNLILKISKK